MGHLNSRNRSASDSIELLRAVLAAGADLKARELRCGSTALHFAARLGPGCGTAPVCRVRAATHVTLQATHHFCWQLAKVSARVCANWRAPLGVLITSEY